MLTLIRTSVLACIFAGGLMADDAIITDLSAWNGCKGQAPESPWLELIAGPTDGKTAVKACVHCHGEYQGLVLRLPRPINMADYEKISFIARIRQGKYYGPHTSFSLQSSIGGNSIFQYFLLKHDEWTLIEIPLDPKSFKNHDKIDWKHLPPMDKLAFFKKNLRSPGDYLIIDQVRLHSRRTDTAALKVKSYQHLQPCNDSNATLLTDGIVKRDAQVVWESNQSGNPEIIFDLAKPCFVEKIQLDAYGRPSQNIATVVVCARNEGEAWRQVASLSSTDDSGELKHQVFLLPQVNGIGRYFKVQILRPRHDSPVALGEVRFHGRIPTLEDYQKSALRHYTVGPDMPAISAADYWTLADGEYTAFISKKNGIITDMQKNGRVMVARILPWYMLEYQNGKILETDGYADRVKEHRIQDKELTVVLENPQLPGVTVTRRFRFRGDDLERQTAFEYDGNEKAFFSIGHKMAFPQAIRKDGVYETFGGMHSFKRVFANEITDTLPVDDIPIMSLYSLAAKKTFWQYRRSRANRFIPLDVQLTLGSKQTYCTAVGWEMFDAVFTLDQKAGNSVGTILAMGDGDIDDLYKRYREHAEVKRYYSWIQRPKYMKTIRCVAEVSDYEVDKQIGDYEALLREGEVLVPALGAMNFTWGDFPVRGDVRGAHGGRRTADGLHAWLASLKQRHPRCRFSLYTWLWSAMTNSSVYTRHPEWFIQKDRNGAIQSFWPCEAPNLYRYASIKESQDEMVRQITAVLERYDQDIWYLDGGSSTSKKDWYKMKLDTPEGWNEAYRRIITRARKNNPDLLVFFNSPFQPAADIGFLENSGDAMQDWRAAAAWMWKMKMFQLTDPMHFPSYIYWRTTVNRLYPDYMAGLGMMPCLFNHVLSHGEVPFLSAQHEAKTVALAPANISPDWRFDPTVELESFTLTQGPAAITLLRSFAKGVQDWEVAVDADKLNLSDASQPVYQYLAECRRYLDWKGRLGESEREQIYASTGWMPDRYAVMRPLNRTTFAPRVTTTFKLKPEVMYQWILTQSPALVFSIDNLPLQIPRAETLGVCVTGTTSSDAITMRVESTRTSAEIVMPVPIGKTIGKLLVDGRETPWRPLVMNGRMCAIFAISSGTHDAACALSPLGMLQERAAIQEFAVKGDKIVLTHSPDRLPFCLQVELDEQPVWSTSSVGGQVTIPLAAALRKGEYVARLYTMGGHMLAEKRFPLAGGPSCIKTTRIVSPKKVRAFEPVKHTGTGFAIRKAGSEYNEGCFEVTFNPDEAHVSLACKPEPRFVWISGCAGYEMTVKRFLKVKLDSNLHYFANHGFRRQSRKPHANDFFIGLTLDFQTDSGWTTRTDVGLGELKASRGANVHFLSGGKLECSGKYMVSDLAYSDRETETLWLDLEKLGAPTGWNGTIWLAPTLSIIAPDRRLEMTILESTDRLPAETFSTPVVDLLAKDDLSATIVPVPKAATPVQVDGAALEKAWSRATPLSGLTFLNNVFRRAPQKTTVRFIHDGSVLFMLAECQENKVIGSSTGKIYAGDSLECIIEKQNAQGQFLHFIISPDGKIFRKYEFVTREHKPLDSVYPDQYKVTIEQKKKWVVEAAVPLEALGLSGNVTGKQLAFNVMRNRFSPQGTQFLTLAPGNSYFNLKCFKLAFE